MLALEDIKAQNAVVADGGTPFWRSGVGRKPVPRVIIWQAVHYMVTGDEDATTYKLTIPDSIPAYTDISKIETLERYVREYAPEQNGVAVHQLDRIDIVAIVVGDATVRMF